jgi:hypothetical protein
MTINLKVLTCKGIPINTWNMMMYYNETIGLIITYMHIESTIKTIAVN